VGVRVNGDVMLMSEHVLGLVARRGDGSGSGSERECGSGRGDERSKEESGEGRRYGGGG
jgi:hypothetical protein